MKFHKKLKIIKTKSKWNWVQAINKYTVLYRGVAYIEESIYLFEVKEYIKLINLLKKENQELLGKL